MSGADTPLPRVLTAPKLHRRPQADICVGGVKSNDVQKYKCPPIEVLKEKQENIVKNGLENGINCRPDISSYEKTVAVQSPFSAANGASAACVAMANACSHDHDYISSETSRVERPLEVPITTPIEIPEDYRIRIEMKTVRVPVPPKPHVPTSPREAKPARGTGNRLGRRYIRADDVSDFKGGRPGKAQESNDIIDNKYIFVSTRKTAEPKASRGSSRRKYKRKTSQVIKSDGHQTASDQLRDVDEMMTNATFEFSLDSPSSQSDAQNEFDVSSDVLTREWKRMVEEYEKEKKRKNIKSDDVKCSENGQQLRPSTPVIKVGEGLGNVMKFISPRPSITPCPPNISRVNEKYRDENVKSSDVTGNDSAYFSMTSSICSQPTNSIGTPIFRSESYAASIGRPSTGNRPPSGGKRVAATSLSSSSSCTTSSDEESEYSPMMSPTAINSSKSDDNEEGRTNSHDVTSPESTSRNGSGISLSDHKAVKSRKGKKFVCQVDVTCAKKAIVKPQIRPVPPRKPKKDPLPMHLRALPTSFFQEPNRVSPSPYSVLPPVQPLFRQGSIDDVADIRPVTPPGNRSQDVATTPRRDQMTAKVVIKTGDTDLLQRLFDKVDPQHKTTGIRVKRGRPKRAPRSMPSPRLKLGDNPCIMQSITEKLFPKLSIDRRSFGSRTSNRPIYVTTAHPPPLKDDNQCSNGNLNKTLSDSSNCAKEWTNAGLLSIKSNLSGLFDDDSDFPDVPMEITSPTPTSQRQETLALPHLPGMQDYAQLLTEVAAIL